MTLNRRLKTEVEKQLRDQGLFTLVAEPNYAWGECEYAKAKEV
jgi:hypothetical protein